MRKIDPVKLWLNTVAYAHSGSKHTRENYTRYFAKFCNFLEAQPDAILEEYENMNDRDFRRKYAKYIKFYLSHLRQAGFAPNTINDFLIAVKSFFKYNDLPLGYVPSVKGRVIYHNRDITRKEINLVLQVSKPRDKAFFCVMSQSGLRPHTLCQLKMEHIEPDFSKEIIPCKIDVPSEIAKGKYLSHFTFMGEESVRYLKAYLSTRRVGKESYLFLSRDGTDHVSKKAVSIIFTRTLEKLKAKGLLDFEQKARGKPRTVRLYNLRKYFRKFAGQCGVEYVNFWMGHAANYKASHIPSSDESYRPEDVEFHRKIYREKAVPFLRLEESTPGETERTLMELKRENTELKQTLKAIQPLLEFAQRSPKALQGFLNQLSDVERQRILTHSKRWNKRVGLKKLAS